MDIFEYIDKVKANFDKQPEPRYNMKKYFMGGSVTTPKRGLVDEPGSYSQDKATYDKTYYEKNKEKILEKLNEKRFDLEKSKEKIKKAENVEAWKKANPDLDFDSLFDSMKTRIRQGDLTAGTFRQKTPGIYTIQELAKVEGMPFANITLQNAFVPSKIKTKQSKKLLEAFKNAGIEKLPKTKPGQTQKYKMLNPKESMEKLIEYAMTLDRPPKKLIDPYYKQIPIEYKKLVESGKPFSIEKLRIKVLEALPENVYKLNAEGSFNAMVKKTLNEKQIKKFVRGNILTRTENLQPRKIIIDNILDGKTNIKQLAKASNLSEKEVGEQISRIFKTIYRSREDIGAKRKVKDVILKDYSLKDFEKILTNINKEPTLGSFFRKSYRDFLFDAIGNPNNPDTYQPKKYARAMERLKAYNSINQKLKDAFGISLTLDHSLSRGAIKTIENAQPSQFIRINPIPEKINSGIKKSFDIRYQKVIKALQSGEFRGEELKNLLIQKVELERLAKDIGLPFGKMSPTGKIIKYDAVDFLNKNLPSEIKAGVSLPNKIRQAVDKIDPAVLKKRFEVAFGDRADNVLEILNKIKKQDNLQDIYKFLKPLLRIKGLRVDASDFLNTISDAIVPQAAAAEVLPEETGAEIPKTDETQDSLPTSIKESGLPSEIIAAITPLIAKYGPSVAKSVGNLMNRLGVPMAQALYAVIEPVSLLYTAPFTQMSSKPSGVYKPGKTPVQKFTRFLNKFGITSPAAAEKFTKNISKGSTLAYPFLVTAIEGFKAKKRLEDAKKKSSVFEPTVDTLLGEAPESYYNEIMSEIPSEGRLKEFSIPFTDKKFTLPEVGVGEFQASSGGIASGPPPEKGPQSQGLAYLMKNGKR